MSNLLAQHGIGGQPDGVEIARLLQPRLDCRVGISGVGSQETHKVARGILGDHRVEDVPPAIGTVEVAIAQGAAFHHAELVE